MSRKIALCKVLWFSTAFLLGCGAQGPATATPEPTGGTSPHEGQSEGVEGCVPSMEQCMSECFEGPPPNGPSICYSTCRAQDALGKRLCVTRAGQQRCLSYSDQQSVPSYEPAPGRTGDWWCTAHLGDTLGGVWRCLSVQGGSCDSDAPGDALVSCGRCSGT